MAIQVLWIIAGVLAIGLLRWAVANLPWIDDGMRKFLLVCVTVVGGLWLIYRVFLILATLPIWNFGTR